MINIRKAKSEELEQIIELLANGKLGVAREKTESHLATYQKAFAKINEDPNQYLMVMEKEGKVIGCLQLSFIQYLTYNGGMRAQIEGVWICAEERGKNLGKTLIKHAIFEAKERGAHLVQLTTDKQRPEAIAFYENLGFVSSHEGMKMHF